MVSLLAETHRKLEAEKAEVDSLRAFSTGLLLNLLAFATAAYTQGFAAGGASLAGQDVEYPQAPRVLQNWSSAAVDLGAQTE